MSKFTQEIAAYTDQVQEFEDACFAVYQLFSGQYKKGVVGSANQTGNAIDAALQFGIDNNFPLDSNGNEQNGILDNMGEWPGVTRQTGMTNADFANLIKAQILMNKSGGEPETLILALKTLTGVADCVYSEPHLRWAQLSWTGNVPQNLYNQMKRLTAGSVALVLVQTGSLFLFDNPSPNGFDSGLLG